MSCGVRYEFSLINAPKAAHIIVEELEQVGTPHDAEAAGAADPRRAQPGEVAGAEPPSGQAPARGRQRHGQ